MSANPTPSYHEEAYSSLMKGLTELDMRGPHVPCPLVLIGDDAFPLAMNTQGQVLMAASRYGRGRIVVLGHEGYLTTLPALVENALTWLRGSESDNLLVGVHQNSRSVAQNLSRSSFQAKEVGGFHEKLGVGVYVTDAYSVGAYAKGLVEYLKAGGGVLIAGQAVNWAALNPKENVLQSFPGNKVSSVAGIYFSDHYGKVECLPVTTQIPSSYLAVAIGKDFKDDLELLVQGVSEFDISGPSGFSEILVHGPLAFPIATTSKRQAFVAGAYYGLGRVIVISHEGFLGNKELQTFWNNAIQWLDQGRKGVVGVLPTLGGAHSLFSKAGLKCEKTEFRKDLSVYVCTSYSDAHKEEIQEFVAEGGGVIVGGHAWYWTYSHHGENALTEYPGNHIVNKMGLSIMGNIVTHGCYKAPVPGRTREDGYHFRHQLQRFAGHVTQGEELPKNEEECCKKLGKDCASYLQMKTYDSSSYTLVLSTLTDISKEAFPQVCPTCPVKSPKDRLLLHVGAEVYKVCPDPEALLPHLIKDIPEMPAVYNNTVTIHVNTAGQEAWISTGLYLSPGMQTTMTMPPEIVNKGWKVQIGCQSDNLCRAAELKRAATVNVRFPVNAEKVQVSNMWGGLIYLVAPPRTQVEGLEVMVEEAVRAPYYKSGVTTPADWLSLRTAPSPWAELEFENIVLTLPSKEVRGLDHPDQVASLWDDVMKAVYDLAAHKFQRKERIVADVQISAGWMHSGYPIMMHSTIANELVDVETTRRSGQWGFYHELGHNQQRGCWEFPPHTGECTCNLWSVYVNEEVLGIDAAKAHTHLKPEERKERTEEYVKGGRNLDSWSVWTALETYLQLKEEFGWESFKKVFAAYRNMTDINDNDNKGKMNLYAETFSQAVGKNLVEFFKAWGWPIEPATEEKLSSLPAWQDHPMVQYG